jgi:hypothetical protein
LPILPLLKEVKAVEIKKSQTYYLVRGRASKDLFSGGENVAVLPAEVLLEVLR